MKSDYWRSLDDSYINKVIYDHNNQQELLRHFLHYHQKFFELDLSKPYRYIKNTNITKTGIEKKNKTESKENFARIFRYNET